MAKGDREREQRKRERERDKERDRDREHGDRDRDRDHHRRPSRAVDSSPTPNPGGSNTALVGGSAAQGILTPAAIAAAAQGKSSRRHTRDRERDRERERERERLGVSVGLGVNPDASLSVQPIAPSSRRGSQQVARGDSKTGLTGGDLGAGSGSGLALPHPYASANMNINGMSPAGSTGAVNSAGGYRTSNVTGSNSPLPPIPNDPRVSGGNDSDGHTYLNNNNGGNHSGYGNTSPYLQGAQANSSMQRTKMVGFPNGVGNGFGNGNGNGTMREQMDEDGKERYGEHKGGFWSVFCCRA